MNFVKSIALVSLPMALVACGGQPSQTESITVEPTMTKIGKLSMETTGPMTFAYNNNTTADYKGQYARCAAKAGIKGEIKLALKDFGAATTIDLADTPNVSETQRGVAFGCMNSFAQVN